MITVTQTELRDNIKKYMDEVARGEDIEVCRHGKPFARVSLIRRKKTPSWKRGEPLRVPGASLSKIIIEDRR